MELGLKEKVVLVAGSSRGIGKSIACKFLEEGCHVVVSGRNREGLENTIEEFRARFPKENIGQFNGDLTRQDDCERYVQVAVSKWARVDIAVANIGSGRGVPFELSDRQEWMRVFETNLFSGMDFVRHVTAVMKAQRSGAICLVSSIAGTEAIDAPIPYISAKAGVIACGKALARHLGDFNIRVNVVCPGNVLFPEGDWEVKLRKNEEQVRSYIQSQVPLKRFGRPEEIAACIVFLMSERASFVTGASLVVDGGQTRAF